MTVLIAWTVCRVLNGADKLESGKEGNRHSRRLRGAEEGQPAQTNSRPAPLKMGTGLAEEYRAGGKPTANRTLARRKELIPLAINDHPAADAAATQILERRSGRIGGWLRELLHPEPAEVRRQRIEAEAAAELGLTAFHQSEHAAIR